MNSPVGWRAGFVAERLLRVLQVSTLDNQGGAGRVAWNLHQAYRGRGLHARMVVGWKFSDDPSVVLAPNHKAKSLHTRLLLKVARRLRILDCRTHGTGRLGNLLQWLAEPRRWWDIRRGIEDFHYPATQRLLEFFPEPPDIVHCHNLHGGYFDLRALPWLSGQVPVVLTLHDAWLLSGHCSHSFDCERWKTGCGHCPDLTIYPAIQRDATDYNWRRKREIYAKSQLYVATPSRWLMQKVKQSILATAVIEARVIPNGIDLSVFSPTDRRAVRAALDIPQDTKVLLFVAHGIKQNIFKDYQTMRAAIAQVAERPDGQDVLFIALGEDSPAEPIGQAKVRFVPYQGDPQVVARYYQAADLYIYAAKVDTFPNTVLEALACGTPVVATAVGGIPEQIKGLQVEGCRFQVAGCEPNRYEDYEATGMLVPVGDAEGMADAIVALLTNEALRWRLGENAAKDARQRFDLQRQVDDYLTWYQKILDAWQDGQCRATIRCGN